MIHLSKRLTLAKDMLPKGNKVADIGADHGYLIASLIEDNIFNYGFAVENKIGPFNILTSNLKKYTNITCSLSDGISKLPNDVDTVCILGMGGDTISYIISSSEDKISNVNYFLVSSHCLEDEVYNTLSRLNYGIVSSKAIFDQKKYYEIYLYKKNSPTVELHKYFKENHDEFFIKHLNDELEKLNNLLKLDLNEVRIKEINTQIEYLKNELKD